jgi:hypothetical protein
MRKNLAAAAADLVALARNGVEFDYRCGVIDAHAPEMPTRFAKSSPNSSAAVPPSASTAPQRCG